MPDFGSCPYVGGRRRYLRCTGAGYATVCAQGEVRGGGPTPPSSGPTYPGYCADPWYCDDGWDLDVIVPPRPPLRPGGGGGIGPRR
jgi:hypothetical protein